MTTFKTLAKSTPNLEPIAKYDTCVSLTVSPPADGSSFDQYTLVVSVQMVLQVLLFLGLGAEFQVNVVGELCEVAEAFLSTAHTVP